jgi:4,5-DOPA dioxygenase extradiol
MALTPSIFFGHGSPVLTLTRNPYTDAWKAIGKGLAKPKGIVCVSAHWFTTNTGVLISEAPETIHDFGGFQKELVDIRYPAPGDPNLARRVQKLLGPVPVELSSKWGFDHGTWTVMRHVFPEADVPIVQLSIDAHLPSQFHYQLGQRLAPLREEGVMIIGSGNVVHNLARYVRNQPLFQPFDWAKRFESRVKSLLVEGEHKPLAEYSTLGPDVLLAVPTPDHYLPLLYVLGAHAKQDKIEMPISGIDGGSMSMLTVKLG